MYMYNALQMGIWYMGINENISQKSTVCVSSPSMLLLPLLPW